MFAIVKHRNILGLSYQIGQRLAIFAKTNTTSHIFRNSSMQNTAKDLLKPQNTVSVQQRPTVSDTMATATEKTEISLETPVEDYTKLMEREVQNNELTSDEVMQANFKRISAAGRETVWKLLFGETPTTEENKAKAAELLGQIKGDACFYAPWDYNNWVKSVRDELLKREMLDFWRDVMVKNELGPCWARDSDYFEDLEDKSAEEFYKYAGCVAPFSKEAEGQSEGDGKKAAEPTTTTAPPAVSPQPKQPKSSAEEPFEAKISLETPVQDYESLMNSKVVVEDLVEDEILTNNYKRISAAARETVWQLLFGETPASEQNQAKAGELLQKVKSDACFYAPWDYNDWISKVRDELLKREMLNFWRDVMVKNALGPCWARDSDYFDDMEDKSAEEFYKHAGCVAPFA